MKIIGLTGPSGSGKGELSRHLAKYGVRSIDADEVYHNLLLPPSKCLDELTETFGNEILFPDGTLDRHTLSEIVFASEEKLLKLNSITHKFVIEKIEGIIKEYEREGLSAVIIDAPLLFEASVDKRCDLTVAVIADRETRLPRIMARDGLSLEDAEMRIANQPDDEFYKKRAMLTVFNDGSEELLSKEAERIYREVILP